LRVTSVPVDAATRALLPQTHVSDAYRLIVHERTLDATTAARRIFERAPRWIHALMALRNRLVAPLGLNTFVDESVRKIGIFPVIAETPNHVLLGLDDKHLDFRIAVDVVALGGAQHQVTTTTVVRTHNQLGRIYLEIVLPFHRVIVPTMVAQAAKS
jgi:uncharacterized protein DUF2867